MLHVHLVALELHAEPVGDRCGLVGLSPRGVPQAVVDVVSCDLEAVMNRKRDEGRRVGPAAECYGRWGARRRKRAACEQLVEQV